MDIDEETAQEYRDPKEIAAFKPVQVKKVEKPIIGKRTMLGQAFDECFKDYPFLRTRKDGF